MVRQGQLDKDAVYGWVMVGFGDLLDNLELRDRFGKVDDIADYTGLGGFGGLDCDAIDTTVIRMLIIPRQQLSISYAHRCLHGICQRCLRRCNAHILT